MNATTDAFNAKFLQGTHAKSKRLTELQALLVPAAQNPVTGYGELLRVTVQLYQILHTNLYSFGNLPYEAYILSRFKEQIEARMSYPAMLTAVLRMLTADVSPDVKALRAYEPAFEDILGAVVSFVDGCVRVRIEDGQDPAQPLGLIRDPDHELASFEKALISRHLRGIRAKSFEGELFRAMYRVAQVQDVSGMYPWDLGNKSEDLSYELMVIFKFMPELDHDFRDFDVTDIIAELRYLYAEKAPIPANGWTYQSSFQKLCRAVVKFNFNLETQASQQQRN